MTQTTALIIHNILDSVEHWRSVDDYITDGYYRVALDGRWYSMGQGKYGTLDADIDSFHRAISEWKRITKWKAPVSDPGPIQELKEQLPLGNQERKFYDDFVRAVRTTLNGFNIHKNSVTLSMKIQESLDALDNELYSIKGTVGRELGAKGN